MKYKILCLAFLSILTGCSNGPPALRAPYLDPESAAADAIELYDKDGDGQLSVAELEDCSGILASISAYDKNGDEQVSAEEIAQRLQTFVDSKVAIGRLIVSVRLDGSSLEGATIRFIPEDYLGDEIKPAMGQTNGSGTAAMAVAKEDLPESQKELVGVHFGTYRVEITHPSISIPAKYNTESTLGFEPAPASIRAKFELSSN